ncbi:hypothetical protein BUALT_Bualt10G0039200 [Buddleja alternifolia]|uniref:Transcriptional regulator SLK2 n=1 Tax=Buddleja alternifolia TaxID=168488 RepID=A0AAV6X350_9LAMI|nr:hypothetical protein BUALT_Bualt10G0039200 [Buddleja alternifolia]
MALEAFLDSNSQLAIPLMFPISGSRGILEALSSRSSLKNEEHLKSMLGMAQWDTNLVSDVMNSTIMRKSSTSGSAVDYDADFAVSNLTLPTGASLQSHGSPYMEPYVSLPSSPMSFPSDNSVTDFSTDDAFAYLCEGGQKERERKQLGKTKASTDLSKSKLQICQDSLPVKIKQEQGLLNPILKKPRLDVNQEKIQQQQQEHQIIQELLLKELQDRNPQLKAMIKQYREQNQLQPPILHSVAQLRGFHLEPTKQQMRSFLHDQGNQPGIFTPLLDSGICSRRFMQYLYHLRNLTHDNGIAYWKNFVREYYAPGARTRWCFSNYGNIQQHATGVFCPKSMETWCCDICGLRSGKGLEATFEAIPRLFKIKFESGMLDEILFLELPRACKIPSGLVLEYQKAVQESVYENFRVVHEGKLRIVFRHDLKILSWEFCALNHEEFLLRRLVAPQVNQLVQAAEKYQNGNQNAASIRVSSKDLQTKCEVFVSAGDQLARTMDLPLVNDLGYPKRFIRCLQISEVVNSMKDLMDYSHDRKMGPIASLNNYSQGAKTGNQVNEKQEMELYAGAGPGFRNGCLMTDNGIASGSGKRGFTLVNSNNQFFGQNFSIPPERSKPYEHGKTPHQALVDKLLHDMVAANRGKSVKDKYGKLNDENAHQPYQNTFTSLLNGTMQQLVTGNELLFGESSNAASRTDFAKASSNGSSSAVGHNITVKEEPKSPEQLPEYLQNLSGLSKIGDLEW